MDDLIRARLRPGLDLFQQQPQAAPPITTAPPVGNAGNGTNRNPLPAPASMDLIIRHALGR
jgi:hypothetical protein